MSEVFEIAGVEIAPGTARTVQVPIARRYSADEMHMAVRVLRGKKPGPCLFVTGAIHGDEINGVEIVRRLVASPRLKRLQGTLLAVPVVNVYGFLQQIRYLPDRRDLNRSFPGSERGSLAARLANSLCTEVVMRADAGIDLHTGSLHRNNLPQIRARLSDPETLRLARAFGAPVMLDSAMRDGSLRVVCAERGIPLLLYEGGQALRFDELAIRAGLRGIVSVMQELGMLKSARRTTRQSAVAGGSQWVRAPHSGVLRSGIDLGARVHAGQVLATVADPLGEDPVEVLSPCDGIVVGATQLPLVNEGDAVYHVARFRRPDAVSNHIEGFVDELTDADFSPEPEGEPEQ